MNLMSIYVLQSQLFFFTPCTALGNILWGNTAHGLQQLSVLPNWKSKSIWRQWVSFQALGFTEEIQYISCSLLMEAVLNASRKMFCMYQILAVTSFLLLGLIDREILFFWRRQMLEWNAWNNDYSQSANEIPLYSPNDFKGSKIQWSHGTSPWQELMAWACSSCICKSHTIHDQKENYGWNQGICLPT